MPSPDGTARVAPEARNGAVRQSHDVDASSSSITAHHSAIPRQLPLQLRLEELQSKLGNSPDGHMLLLVAGQGWPTQANGPTLTLVVHGSTTAAPGKEVRVCARMLDSSLSNVSLCTC